MSENGKDLEPVHVLELEHPIENGSNIIDKLEFVTLKGKHLRGLPLASADGTISLDLMLMLIQRLSGEPPKVIDQLQGNDLMKALKVAGDFFEEVL